MDLNSLEPIYYVYRHVRLDKNEVFYVGMGTLNKKGEHFHTKYKRACCKKKNTRNIIWRRIVAITEYEIEILFHSTSLNEVLDKEAEFIKLYGRKNLGEGSLINLMDGYNRPSKYVLSEETRLKMSKNSNLKGKFGHDHHLSKPIFAYKASGEFISEFGSRRQASEYFNIANKHIYLFLNGEVRHSRGLLFFEEFMGDAVKPVDISNPQRKKVKCFNSEGVYLRTFDSVTMAANFFNSSTTNISKAAKNPFKSLHKKHYFEYV